MKRFKSILIFLVKIGISLGILAFLVSQTMKDKQTVESLLHDEKIWSSLVLGFLFTFLAVLGTILRWWWLVRIQGLRAGFWKTLRIGYIGYLFNLAPMGIVGGDLLKAWLLTRSLKEESPHAGPVILGSMFIDRMIGLYALFLLASIVLFFQGTLWNPASTPLMLSASWAVLIACGIGTVAGLALLLPPESKKELPPPRSRAGEIFRKIAASVRLYRKFPGKLTWILGISLLIHTLFATSLYFLADGLWPKQNPPGFTQHLFISPTSMSMSAIPLPAGPVEDVFERLYHDVNDRVGMGLIVMLSYRLCCLITALLGVIFYFSARDEIRATMKEQKQS